MSDPLLEGYAYRFAQGETAHGKQERPTFYDEVDLHRWAQGWMQADDDARAGRPARYEVPEPPAKGPEPGENHPVGGGLPPPPADPGEAPWMRATIHRTESGWVLDLDGKVTAFQNPGKGKAPARLLEVLVTEIGKRMLLDGAGEALAEIHKKTKGAP